MADQFPHRPYVGSSRPPGAPGASSIAGAQTGFLLHPPYVHGRVIPSITEFLDDAPPIEDFAPSRQGSDWPAWGGEAAAAAGAAEGWASADWQGYDWNAASRLTANPSDAVAAEAWASTDWDEQKGSGRASQSAADALAEALDQIARRIRAGELSVSGSGAASGESPIAAALAALLGTHR